MALDYGVYRVGNVFYPLNPSLANSQLQDIDPFLYYGLSYFQAMLEVHMGSRWNAAIASINGLPSFPVVASVLPFDPTPYFKEEQTKFPLLALWETDSITEPKTFSWYHTKASWRLIYSLPPLTVSQMEILYPFTKAANKIIIDRTEQGYDPNYNSSQQVWDDGYGGIESIQVTKTQFKNIQTDPQTKLFFPTVMMTLEVCIREEFRKLRDGSYILDPLTGVDTTQLLDGYEFLQTSTDFPNPG